jgi:hypothetical protein
MNNSKSKINEPIWNKLPLIKVNNIDFNIDKSLLILSTNYGYRIYDNKAFNLLSSLDKNQENFGSLKKTSVFFSSYLICFLGTDNNEVYRSNQIFFYNDYKKKNIALINFHEKIYDFFLSKYLFIICLKNKILIYELSSLKYIYQIEEVEINKDLISINNKTVNKIKLSTLAYISKYYKDLNVISLITYIIDNNYKISHFKKNAITTIFNNISKIKLENNNKLIAVSELENKIHIYDINYNNLLFCIYLGNNILNLDFSFSEHDDFFSCFFNNEIDIFKLKDFNNYHKYQCNCYSHSDKENIQKKKINSSIKDYFIKMFDDSTETFLRNNINLNGDFFKCYFNHYNDNEIILISNNGNINIYNFNKFEKKNLEIIKEISLFQ